MNFEGEIKHLHLKDGMPTVDEARRRLLEAINEANRDGTAAIIVIHGYGSHGVGGKLKIGVQKSLRLRVKEKKIRAFVAGENWRSDDATSNWMIDECPELAYDPDLDAGNPGMSVVLI